MMLIPQSKTYGLTVPKEELNKFPMLILFLTNIVKAIENLGLNTLTRGPQILFGTGSITIPQFSPKLAPISLSTQYTIIVLATAQVNTPTWPAHIIGVREDPNAAGQTYGIFKVTGYGTITFTPSPLTIVAIPL